MSTHNQRLLPLRSEEKGREQERRGRVEEEYEDEDDYDTEGVGHVYNQPAKGSRDLLSIITVFFMDLNNSNGRKSLLKRIAICFGVFIAFLITFKAGQWNAKRQFYILDKSDLDISEHKHTFVFEEIYGSKPDEQSNKVWADMFPIQGGFFRHPQLSPERGAFAVFHQLHCLDGIRMAYWQLHGQSYPIGKANKIIPEEELPLMTSPDHVAHCIDLIRNALVCQPDLTVETKNLTLQGVTGFGTEHLCLDWNKVMSWTSKWETWGQDPKDREKHDKAVKEGKLGGHNHGHDHSIPKDKHS